MPDETNHEHATEPQHGGYEQTEASMRVVLYFVGSLLVFGIIAHAVLAAGYWILDQQRGPHAVSQAALPRDLPPEPRLQVAPARDMSADLKQEDQELKGKGTPQRLPLDQAMQQVLKAGLPSRPSAAPPEDLAGVPLESGGTSQILPSHYLTLAGPGDLGNPYPGGEGIQSPPRGLRTPANAAPKSPGEFGAPPVPTKPDEKNSGEAHAR
jgi:hypothetical protein